MSTPRPLQTKNIVNLLTCTKCQQQYVGEIKGDCQIRIIEHLKDIRLDKDTPVAKHFNKDSHNVEHEQYQIVYSIQFDPTSDHSTKIRRSRECFWMYQLHTLHNKRTL